MNAPVIDLFAPARTTGDGAPAPSLITRCRPQNLPPGAQARQTERAIKFLARNDKSPVIRRPLN
jgi:hypothetical protein